MCIYTTTAEINYLLVMLPTFVMSCSMLEWPQDAPHRGRHECIRILDTNQDSPKTQVGIHWVDDEIVTQTISNKHQLNEQKIALASANTAQSVIEEHALKFNRKEAEDANCLSTTNRDLYWKPGTYMQKTGQCTGMKPLWCQSTTPLTDRSHPPNFTFSHQLPLFVCI